MSDPWEGDSDSQILVSHGSEVTWTWVWVTHGFLEIFEKCFEGQLEGFKKEMFQKRYFQKRKILKIAFLRCLKTFLKRKFTFLEIPFLEHFLLKTFQLALKPFFKNFQKSMSYLYPSPSNFRSVGNKYVWVQVSFPTDPSHLWVNSWTALSTTSISPPQCCT